MPKRIMGGMLLFMTVFLCSCGMITVSPIDQIGTSVSSAPESESSAADHALLPPRFTVTFEENEVFRDEASKRAASLIDPAIETAVRLLNTLPDREIDILDCDYSTRPTEKDNLTDDESRYWYDFIYEKMSAMEDFCLDPADYGGEEALYLPFYTAESALMADHREIFLCGTIWMGDDGTIYPIYFMPGDWVDTPCSDKEVIENEAAVYYRIIDRIFEKMPQDLNHYQKICYFIFVIAARTEYYHDNYDKTASVYTPYDALVKGKTVCRGYSGAFYELCRRAGISCWDCSGMVPSGFHAWNRVETTEGMLGIDITGYDGPEIKDHYADGDTDYLFMTMEEMNNWGYREGELE